MEKWQYKLTRVILSNQISFNETQNEANDKINNLLDLNKREIISIIPLVIIAILLGIYPNIILDTISESSNNIIETFNQKTNLEVVKNE